ncbi:uncharacterized protein LOC105786689 [Gossypium raimondii]|uniref:uncharacterized protein LOC105786689 n=1 Tax=Gossypium raimondii TaxID=29730 RepID=UPI00063ADFFC|nr:uncharacterized protein LOC105786689 [Gossypium raimondii]
MVLKTNGDKEVAVIGERRDFLSNVISALRAEKLVRKGCEAFLAYISVSDSWGPSIGDIKTVRDFSDVFPDELPGLPPSREVEFGIELLPGTAPVSIAPYRMTSNELVELKAQIHELLDRGFIQPILTKLLRKGVMFNWTDRKQESFEKLKKEDKVVAYANVVADALNGRPVSKLRVMFARLSLFDDGTLLAELQVRPTWTEQIKGLLWPVKIPLWKWEGVTVDFVSGLPLTPTKKDLAWVILDRQTKSAHFIPVRTDYSLQKLAKFWEDYLPLAESKYNNSYLSSIQMAPYEALYGRSCRTPTCWTELGERHYRSDPTHIGSVEEIEARLDLTFEEEPVQILDHEVKVLRKKSIPLFKVLWCNHSSEEATWEPEEAMRQQYPHLF